MPKTPRKNPTPKKLPHISPGELQEEESVGEFCTEDSFTTAVNELVSNSQSVFGRCADVTRKSSASDIAPVNIAKSTTVNVDCSDKTSAKSSRRLASRVSRGRQKKACTKPEGKIGDHANSLQTDSASAVGIGDGAPCASMRDTSKLASEYCKNVPGIDISLGDITTTAASPTNKSMKVISTDNNCNKGINVCTETSKKLAPSGVMTACDMSSTTGIERTTAADQLANADEMEDVYLPTPKKDQLRVLSEELFSLNQESAHLTTNIHRRSGTTPRRGQNRDVGHRQSLSTPRKFSSVASDGKPSSRSPRSTPRKTGGSSKKTPWKVKFVCSTTPSKSAKGTAKTPRSKKKSPRSSSVLTFPTPSKKHTKRKLYVESPEHDTTRPVKVPRYVPIMCLRGNSLYLL